MTLEEKLKLWVEITGVDPTEKITKYVLYTNELSDYDIEKMNDNIKSVMEYSNETMTEIVLRNYFLEFLKDRRVTLYDMLTDTGEKNELLSKCRTLFDNLSVTSEEIDMRNTIKNALDFYGKEICLEDINMYEVVSLYVSAKNNMHKLRTVQFKKGKRSTKAPKFSKEVCLFRSIDDLINGINSYSENAVMLCYIHDNEESSGSYFCYVIKNEENIYLMGDMPEYAHPYQKYISRCPSRRMAERVNASFFPYSMTGIDLSNRYHVQDEHTDSDDIVTLGSFNSMELDELIWNIYMLQFIKEKFFDNSYDCEELSYTGNMLNTPLLTKSETTLAIYNKFPTVDIPVYTDISETDNLTYGTERYPHESEGIFKDIVERFKDKVDINELQLYRNSDTVPLIIDKDTFGRDITTDLLTVNTNTFGTVSQIERRSKWALRFNFATKINQLAKQEYKEQGYKIIQWYQQRVLENLPQIVEKAIKDEFYGLSKVIHDYGCVKIQNYKAEEPISLVTKTLTNNINGRFFYPKNEHRNVTDFRCVLTDKKGTICLTISPFDYKNLCEILNISVDELPIPIRNWRSTERRLKGNHLTDDFDPMDWVIKDYWYSMNFSIAIVLSKSAYNQKRKEYGLPEDKFWNEKEVEN